MKKTLTVNLGGTVFNIDEDAYQLLDKYLSNLRIHFRKEEGSDEIMTDFELRISELFNEKVRLGYNVITIEAVEEVIKRMGKPEELFGEEANDTKDGAPDDNINKHTASDQSTGKEQSPTKKRLYRNPDDKLLGGVASGIAAYFGWDVTAVRIGLLLLLFFTQVVIIPVYLIFWLIIPIAKTASEKLEMQGKNVTLENIGKTVTDGFEKVSDGVNNYISSNKPRNFIQKLGDVIVQVIGLILKVGAIILVVILTPPLIFILFIFLVIIFALIVGGSGYLYHMMPSIDWSMISAYPEYTVGFGSLGIILTLIIPLGAIIYSILSQVFKYKPVSSGVKWTLLGLWILGLLLAIFCGTYIGMHGMEHSFRIRI